MMDSLKKYFWGIGLRALLELRKCDPGLDVKTLTARDFASKLSDLVEAYREKFSRLRAEFGSCWQKPGIRRHRRAASGGRPSSWCAKCLW